MHVAKQTVMNWEQRFADLHYVLLMYALTHVFLHKVIEGDEAYTTVGKNLNLFICRTSLLFVLSDLMWRTFH